MGIVGSGIRLPGLGEIIITGRHKVLTQAQGRNIPLTIMGTIMSKCITGLTIWETIRGGV